MASFIRAPQYQILNTTEGTVIQSYPQCLRLTEIIGHWMASFCCLFACCVCVMGMMTLCIFYGYQMDKISDVYIYPFAFTLCLTFVLSCCCILLSDGMWFARKKEWRDYRSGKDKQWYYKKQWEQLTSNKQCEFILDHYCRKHDIRYVDDIVTCIHQFYDESMITIHCDKVVRDKKDEEQKEVITEQENTTIILTD